jgi:hypothetical protein
LGCRPSDPALESRRYLQSVGKAGRSNLYRFGDVSQPAGAIRCGRVFESPTSFDLCLALRRYA